MAVRSGRARAASPEPEPDGGSDGEIFSVAWLTQTIRDTLTYEERLQNIWIEGEIFNLTYHSSGHVYFSLKDDQAVINCTFFRGANQRFRHIRMKEGMKLLAFGGVSVYAPRGSYQFNVSRIMVAGEGELRLKIEALKQQLKKEGLFEPGRKRRLPYLPTTIGVVTAPTGAAIQDIIRVARTRYPNINLLLAPCIVQGEDAAASVCAAIEALQDEELGVDVIIAGRGGGSFEDLLAFNDESVVRAYANSRVPIVSAVGHEIDHPLSDLAADAYAATPSAAAERVVPEYAALADRVDECGLRLSMALKNRHRQSRDRLLRLMGSRVYLNPKLILEQPSQRVDLAVKDLRTRTKETVREGIHRLSRFDSLPALFEKSVDRLSRRFTSTSDRLPALYEKNLARMSKRFSLATERLQNFSPLGTLARGFSVVRDEKKNVIRKASEVAPGQRLEVILGEGRLRVNVDEINE